MEGTGQGEGQTQDSNRQTDNANNGYPDHANLDRVPSEDNLETFRNNIERLRNEAPNETPINPLENTLVTNVDTQVSADVETIN
jgi:hypothetical protein